MNFFLKHAKKKKNNYNSTIEKQASQLKSGLKTFMMFTYDGTRLAKSVLLTCLYKSTSEDVVPLHDY